MMNTIYLAIPNECADDVMELLKGHMYGLVKKGDYEAISDLCFILEKNANDIEVAKHD